MMWNQTNLSEFQSCIQDLLNMPQVSRMEHIAQHVKDANCFQHSIFVAYLSFIICKKMGLDAVSAARGGLLHDLYLYDWRKRESHEGNHMTMHPVTALCNAMRLTSLNDTEKDIIVKHMWPLTLYLPRYKESFIVSSADKLCALAEIFRVYRWMKVDQHLDFLPKEHAISCPA